MKKRKIIIDIENREIVKFPKYSKQILNIANQNAGATKPKVVGNVVELFNEFINSETDHSIKNWEKWYKKHNSSSFIEAKEKILLHVNNLKKIINLINEDMIANWINDLVINKTYQGIIIQHEIIKDIASYLKVGFRYANSVEESKNIDGFINNKAVQIKANTFKSTNPITKIQNIECLIIIYKISKNSVEYEFDEDYLLS